MLKDIPHVVKDHPFQFVFPPCYIGQTNNPYDRIQVKKIKASYHVEEVFNIDLPKLQHGTDGLIYTCVNTPYQPGTDPNMYVLSNTVISVHADHPQYEMETTFRKLH